jgi:hypothetical protein
MLKNNLPYLADVTIGEVEVVELKRKCDLRNDKDCVETI